MKVLWTEESRRDLSEICDFISLDSPSSAEHVLLEIVDSTRRLTRFPESGRRVPGWPEQHLREVICPPYRVVYTIENRVVVILAVLHGKRDAAAFLLRLRGEQE
jgi:addiction module RelE/StbE family toxin